MASPEGGSGIEQIQEQQGETDRRQERYVSGRDHLVEHVPYQEGDGQGGRGLRHRDGGTESQWSIRACIETRIVSPGCVAFAPERGGMTLHVISRRMVHRRPYVFAAEPIRRVPQSATATRMRRHEDQVLRLLGDTRIPFTNNTGEGSFRMVKLHDKISGHFRNWGHAEAFLAVRSYLQTGAKHGLAAMELLIRLWTPTGAWLPSAAGSDTS